MQGIQLRAEYVKAAAVLDHTQHVNNLKAFINNERDYTSILYSKLLVRCYADQPRPLSMAYHAQAHAFSNSTRITELLHCYDYLTCSTSLHFNLL